MPYFISQKHSSAILSMFINTFQISETVPTDKLKILSGTDIKHFWGDQLEGELNAFYEEELPTKGNSFLIDTFIPNTLYGQQGQQR